MPLPALHLPALALLALANAAPATPSSPDATQPVAAVEQCVASATQSERSVTFYGQMNTIAGTQRMAIRIDLQERAPGETAFHTVPGPGLGVWHPSGSGVQIYKYVNQVTNLPAPASYRALVSFRWFGAKGHLLRHAGRLTARCAQPEDPAAAHDGRPVRHTTPAQAVAP